MVNVGDKVLILKMVGEDRYNGKVGIVEFIDDMGQLHGTWGFCAIIPNLDAFVILNTSDSITKILLLL